MAADRAEPVEGPTPAADGATGRLGVAAPALTAHQSRHMVIHEAAVLGAAARESAVS